MKKWNTIFDQAALSLKTLNLRLPTNSGIKQTFYRIFKLIASAKIDFDGKVLNLSQTPYTTHIDRETRKKAQLAVSGWLETKETEIDNIYHEMVQKLPNGIRIRL